jgi:hypothetical protein
VAGNAQPSYNVQTSSATIHEVRFDKYQANLRVPSEGLSAGEEIDVEFRVVDTTQKDPIEDGFKGVGAISATAVLTMPSMPGMPKAIPKVHREGVPGDYGIELFFPHGGDYRIDLDLKIPNAGQYRIAFLVEVADERRNRVPRPQPYSLRVMDFPSSPKANQPTPLRMQVLDRKTSKPVTKFDVAHEKEFHLLIASRDLNWFLHEHPEMQPDGTWEIPITFPAGGDYWIYGDVAPAGQGSRVLISKVSVDGPPPTWSTTLAIKSIADDGDLRGMIRTLEPIQVGKSSTIQVKLFDRKTGKPAVDTVPWLGAAGHLMIIHQDGQTIVHSHPSEDESSLQLVKRGIIRFTGRFPRPGLYKAYAQFDWKGQIKTLGFGIKVDTH